MVWIFNGEVFNGILNQFDQPTRMWKKMKSYEISLIEIFTDERELSILKYKSSILNIMHICLAVCRSVHMPRAKSSKKK